MNRHPIGVGGYDRNESSYNSTRPFVCHPGGTSEATIIFTLGSLGIAANLVLMFLILTKHYLRRWSLGLLFHQAVVDLARASLLIPLGVSILNCQPVNKCSMIETAFLLLVTASTINLLTTVLNDAPLQPDDDDEGEHIPLLMESPQCVLFGSFMIWFASITINLGPTFLSGALAANVEEVHNAPSCPLVAGPLRHYILNVLWIMINVLCVALTIFHLHKLYRDLGKSNVHAVRVASLVTTMIGVSAPDNHSRDPRNVSTYIGRMEREGVQRVKMFIVILAAYLVFWGPLFLVTLAKPGGLLLLPTAQKADLAHEITLHISFVHAFINPTLFLLLHKGLRRASLDIICCGIGTNHANAASSGRATGGTSGRHSRNFSSSAAVSIGGGPTDPHHGARYSSSSHGLDRMTRSGSSAAVVATASTSRQESMEDPVAVAATVAAMATYPSLSRNFLA